MTVVIVPAIALAIHIYADGKNKSEKIILEKEESIRNMNFYTKTSSVESINSNDQNTPATILDDQIM